MTEITEFKSVAFVAFVFFLNYIFKKLYFSIETKKLENIEPCRSFISEKKQKNQQVRFWFCQAAVYQSNGNFFLSDRIEVRVYPRRRTVTQSKNYEGLACYGVKTWKIYHTETPENYENKFCFSHLFPSFQMSYWCLFSSMSYYSNIF